MPAAEETGTVTMTTWSLDTIEEVHEFQEAMFTLRRHSVVWRNPDARTPAQSMRLQVDLPDKPNTPILVEAFGAKVRAITMGGTVVSIELLTGSP